MASTLRITTAEGDARGRREGSVRRWRSIPYAAAPRGDLRWRAPVPAPPWTGVYDAREFRFASCQPRWGAGLAPGKFQPRSEDCLTLNVVAPADPSDRLRPVVVFVHGGGYLLGTSALELYSGVNLVARGDVVYVAMNYRLGPLGYLDMSVFSTDRRPIDSNLGVRDQIAALQWVQRNIAAFGGDPSNVTIFGESAGGNAVTTLMVTPTAKPLFHRAIAQSSPAHWIHDREDSARWAHDYVDVLGATPDTAIRALTSATPKALGQGMIGLYKRLSGVTPGHFPLEPVIDEDLIPKWPIHAFRDGTANRVPLIIGTNRREGNLFARVPDALPTKPPMIDAMFRATDPTIQERVISSYPGYPDKRAAISIGADVTFLHPSIEVAEAHSTHAPTYMYRYDYSPPLLRRIGLGATHAMELVAVFGLQDSGFGRATTLLGGRRELRSVTERVQGHWLNFARHGEPLASWPTYTDEQRATLVIDAPPRVENDPHRERRLAWAGFYGYHRPGAMPGEASISQPN